jgi:glycosyltransferase involved in cell wall biosynthesis
VQAKHKKIDIAYCYWNEAQAYAAVLLKRAGLVSKVVSRAHGYDVYEGSRNNGYMPLKRQFIKEMDLILAISNQGKAYLESTYNASGARLQVSRLGVAIPSMTSAATAYDRLNIVSVAFCVPVKRIDKIIDGISEAALRLKDKKITWTHIGNGILFNELSIYASEKLRPLDVDLKFLGNKSNAEVREFFGENSVDIFINTSESEGVPVSIMEAMSYGVPVIAPNIGGISELVSNEYGCLLSDLASVSEIASAIIEMSSKCKLNEIRSRAKDKIIADYNAEQNYQELVCLVSK